MVYSRLSWRPRPTPPRPAHHASLGLGALAGAAPEADRGEAIAAEAVGQAAQHAAVQRHGEIGWRVDRELGVGGQEVAGDLVVLLGLERAGRVDEAPARTHHRARRAEDGALARGAPDAILGRAPP